MNFVIQHFKTWLKKYWQGSQPLLSTLWAS